MTDELKREGEGAKGAADPTMEEILASIRRIIAEDGDGRPEGSAADPEPAGDAPRVTPSDAPGEILDLTEMVADDGSVVSLTPHPEPETPPDTPFAGPALAPDPAPLQNFVAEDDEDEPVPPMPLNEKDSPMSGAVPPAERLVSETIASQARNAFAQVVQASRPPAGTRRADGDARSVEEVVEDLLRPMLKEWLDTHLAGIVERCVAEELARISGRDPNL